MIKEIIFEWQCPACGTKLIVKRELVIDNYTNNIKILRPFRCTCGSRNVETFKLINIFIGELDVQN